MKILFIHQNFPGQFGNLAVALAQDTANEVRALAMHARPVDPSIQVRLYSLLRPSAPETHPLLQEQESHVLRAEACAAAALQLRKEGFEPDVVYAHPGWGEALFIKDVFPRARLVVYCEYYYALEGQDVGFDPELPPMTFQQRCQLRLKNSTNLLSLQIADAAISPTQWQKSTYPAWAQERITVIHDGISTGRVAFNPQASLSVARSGGLPPLGLGVGDEVLTYVARDLEPVRGFQVFMRSLPAILRNRPQAQVVVVGGDDISYGHAAPSGLPWRQHMLQELEGQLDTRRIHFVGKIPAAAYYALLSISRVHSYWTTPFVLSWSFLESAISGVPVIASATAPVQEFAGQFDNVQTVPFFDHEEFARRCCAALAQPGQRRAAPAPRQLELAHCITQNIRLLSQQDT